MSHEKGRLPNVSRVDILELDIDTRLLDLWKELGATAAQNGGVFDVDTVAAYMRAAYGKAYCDALLENPQERGSLCADHGYRVPSPRPLPIDEMHRDK